MTREDLRDIVEMAGRLAEAAAKGTSGLPELLAEVEVVHNKAYALVAPHLDQIPEGDAAALIGLGHMLAGIGLSLGMTSVLMPPTHEEMADEAARLASTFVVIAYLLGREG